MFEEGNCNMLLSACKILVILAICGILPLIIAFVRKQKHKRLPPGPRALPIIGHLHLLVGKKNPHQDLHNLSNKYGPIMHLQFGFLSNIVVSSPRGAEQFLKTHDLVFASRPPLVSAKYMFYEQRDLSFSKYGSYWRNMRKLCTLQLLSNLRIDSFRSMRSQELGLFVESLKQAATDYHHHHRSVVNLSAEIASLSANMSCLMVFGKKYSDDEFSERGFQDVIREFVHLIAAPHLGDYFPFLGSVLLDPQGLTRRMKEVSKIFDKFLHMIIDEHEKLDEQDQSNDFVSTILTLKRSGDIEFEFDHRHIKGV